MTPRPALHLCILAALGLLGPPAHAQRPVSQIGVLDPIGTWNCLIYQEGVQDDEALLLRITEAGFAEVADDLQAEWLPISRWRIRDETLSFTDERTRRRFRAGLRGTTLAGLWRGDGNGEWWCSPLAVTDAITVRASLSDEYEGYFPLPKPALMVAPRYPLQAIRKALEGVVVVCFKVDAFGHIREPRIVELSDPIFRDPTLDALLRSRYAEWPAGRERPPRPGCRTYRYELTQVFD